MTPEHVLAFTFAAIVSGVILVIAMVYACLYDAINREDREE